jgi:hypothetical protein
MNGLDGVRFGDLHRLSKLEQPQELVAIADEVETAIVTWGNASGVTFDSLDNMLYTLWGMLHGLVSLNMAGRIFCTPAQIQQLRRDCLLTLMQGWKVRRSTR